ncbi:thioredoxin [Nocardia panacis]|uniref:Thioredoxin n=1 Tax=Nocardia panacis TaxID=2340916 RepID=A0A3A4KAR9_9NOCA|nr:thioredoxin [Nocardia panacis]RJO76990.1 thioredoxin [Nocardia panacis]
MADSAAHQNTVTVTDASFADDVLLNDKPVLVDFWADWCGPCKMVAPVLEEIAVTHADKLVIAKLDVDANPETTIHYEVQSMPTMLLFRGGQPVKAIVGAKGKAALLRELAEFL